MFSGSFQIQIFTEPTLGHWDTHGHLLALFTITKLLDVGAGKARVVVKV